VDFSGERLLYQSAPLSARALALTRAREAYQQNPSSQHSQRSQPPSQRAFSLIHQQQLQQQQQFVYAHYAAECAKVDEPPTLPDVHFHYVLFSRFCLMSRVMLTSLSIHFLSSTSCLIVRGWTSRKTCGCRLNRGLVHSWKHLVHYSNFSSVSFLANWFLLPFFFADFSKPKNRGRKSFGGRSFVQIHSKWFAGARILRCTH
jgi:hypothetical protein